MRFLQSARLAVGLLIASGLSITTQASACTVADIEIKSVRARFVDACRASPCYSMKGVAVLTNKCKDPIGVEVKIIGLDTKGNPVAARDLWPASTSNIPPGDYTFSLDTWLDYDPDIKKFSLQAVRVRQWRR
jgi:hypothetical protein